MYAGLNDGMKDTFIFTAADVGSADVIHEFVAGQDKFQIDLYALNGYGIVLDSSSGTDTDVSVTGEFDNVGGADTLNFTVHTWASPPATSSSSKRATPKPAALIGAAGDCLRAWLRRGAGNRHSNRNSNTECEMAKSTELTIANERSSAQTGTTLSTDVSTISETRRGKRRPSRHGW